MKTGAKSKFIDGWDENRAEFTATQDRKEAGALVMKAAFSMHEVNGGSLGERPDDAEIAKTLDRSFGPSGPLHGPSTTEHKPKARTS